MSNRTRRPRLLAASLLVLAGVAACDSWSRSAHTTRPQQRDIRPTEWRVAWTVGGDAADTTLLSPWRVAADEERAYVLDRTGYRVAAVNIADGSVAWITGARGSGPEEFLEPSAIAVGPGGEVLVADARNARITILGRDGGVTGHLPLRGISYVRSLCALSDGSLLASTADAAAPLVQLDRTGEVRRAHELPWPDLRNAPALALQSALASADGGRSCVLALNLGRGFTRFDGGSFGAGIPYVEQFDLPDVEVSSPERGVRVQEVADFRVAASSVAADDSLVTTTFEGFSEHQSRLIDVYALADGRYLRSYVTPWFTNQVARGGGMYLMLTSRDDHPALVAATPLETSSPTAAAVR